MLAHENCIIIAFFVVVVVVDVSDAVVSRFGGFLKLLDLIPISSAFAI